MLNLTCPQNHIETFDHAGELLEKGIENLDLVLSDYNMPVMDGFGLFHKLRSLGYQKSFICITGYTLAPIQDLFELNGVCVIAKGSPVEDIFQTINKVLKLDEENLKFKRKLCSSLRDVKSKEELYDKMSNMLQFIGQRKHYDRSS